MPQRSRVVVQRVVYQITHSPESPGQLIETQRIDPLLGPSLLPRPAIMLDMHRRIGLPPFDDPLLGEPASVFQIIKERLR